MKRKLSFWLYRFECKHKNRLFHLGMVITSAFLVTQIVLRTSTTYAILFVWPLFHAIALYRFMMVCHQKELVIVSKYQYKSERSQELIYYIKCDDYGRYEVSKKQYEKLSVGDVFMFVVDPSTKVIVSLKKSKVKEI